MYNPGKIGCGCCAHCEAAHKHFFGDRREIGYDIPGRLAEHVALPTEPLSRLLGVVSDTAGAAMQPFRNTLLALHDAEIQIGEVIVVTGAGVLGYHSGQLGLTVGASRVVMVNIMPENWQSPNSGGK